jgi:hypothetical protein
MFTIVSGNMNDHMPSNTRAQEGDQVARKLVVLKEKQN